MKIPGGALLLAPWYTYSVDPILEAFQSEYEKIALTRSVKEWRGAVGSNPAYADQIAQSSGQLGLKPRFLENISGGGNEAAVDKMMGSVSPGSAGPNEGGYLARKLYKPDSPVTVGEDTSKLLSMKQQYTDTARSLSPEAKSMVPAMYGHQEIKGPAGQLRHISDHEFVPQMKSLETSADPLAYTQRLQDVVAKPMAARGMPMKDIPRENPFHEFGIGAPVVGNPGNAGVTKQGPKLVDFLPTGKGSPVSVEEHPTLDPVTSNSRFQNTKYDASNVNTLRRDVYRPQAPAQVAKPAASAVGGWSFGGAPKPSAVVPKGPSGTLVMPKGPMGTTIMPKAPLKGLGAIKPQATGLLSKATKTIAPIAHAAHL